MWWHYLLVFLGALLVDIVPFPLPPAFTVMIFLQLTYDLEVWKVIVIGVAGSILGRYLLTLYVPRVSGRLFSRAKNDDVRFLGARMKQKGWKGPTAVLLYSLLPLPTTPLFIAGGMARMKPQYLIIPFIIGKFTSDMVAVFSGEYAFRNVDELMRGIISWKSVSGLVLGLLLVFFLLFVDWRTLLQEKKFRLKFHIWK